MTTLSLTTLELRELLTKTVPFADRDSMMPALSGVTVEVSEDGTVTGLATDRYRIGLVKLPRLHPDAAGFRAFLPLTDIKTLTPLYKPERKDPEAFPVHLSVDNGVLTTSRPGYSPNITAVWQLGDGPDEKLRASFRKVIREAFDVDRRSASPVKYNGDLLATFKVLGRETIVVPQAGKPTLIVSTNTIGVIMPLRAQTASTKYHEDGSQEVIAFTVDDEVAAAEAEWKTFLA